MAITIIGGVTIIGGATLANPAANDPYFMYVPLLLETTGTNGQQNNTFLDSSTNNFTITRNGTPTQGSRTPYWPDGQWSNYFNGTSYIRSPGFNFSTSDFTIECFLNTAFLGAGPQFLGGYSAGGENYTIAMNAGGVLGYFLSSTGAGWDIATNQTLGTVVANRWHHIVIARSGTKIRGYFDGVGGTVITTSAAIFNNATNFWLGAAGSAGGNLTGYLSNVRILNGSSAYDANQSTITVPTAPFATGTTNQVLLTCYSNRFIDANTATTAKTITVTGTPSVQAFQPFSPAASYSAATYAGSGYFNGSTDYLTTPANAAFTFGTGDLTLECWIYQTATSTSAYKVIFTDNVYAAAGGYALYSYNNALNLWRGGAEIIAPAGTINLNAWTHVAWTRSGSSNRLFINGTQVGATTTNANSYTGTITYIGASSVPTLFFPGYISNARIVKGTAVYTADFTPPTTPVTNITNTSLLLNMANAGIYDAAAQNDITTVGDAQVSTAQSQWPPSSMKFDGTGDYLNIPDSPALQLGAGNFTIEFWWRPIALSGYQTLFDKGFGSAGGLLIQTGNNNGILNVYVSGVVVITASSGTSVGSWDYYALVRSGSALTLYRNGSSVGSTTSSVNLNAASPWFIGAQNSPSPGSFSVNGYIQDFRITRGVGRTITASPTAAFPTQ